MTERITTPFGAETTAMEVIEGVNLSGKQAIVTGGASGIGVETARALAQANTEVTLAVRNVEVGEEVAANIKETTGNPNVHVSRLDLADLHSIEEFVKAWQGSLHILINNAGIMASPELRTPQGWEMQFATNHLGHFALTTGLHDALTAAEGARGFFVKLSVPACLEQGFLSLGCTNCLFLNELLLLIPMTKQASTLNLSKNHFAGRLRTNYGKRHSYRSPSFLV